MLLKLNRHHGQNFLGVSAIVSGFSSRETTLQEKVAKFVFWIIDLLNIGPNTFFLTLLRIWHEFPILESLDKGTETESTTNKMCVYEEKYIVQNYSIYLLFGHGQLIPWMTDSWQAKNVLVSCLPYFEPYKIEKLHHLFKTEWLVEPDPYHIFCGTAVCMGQIVHGHPLPHHYSNV